MAREPWGQGGQRTGIVVSYQFYKLQLHRQVGFLPRGDAMRTTPLSRRSLSGVERKIHSPVSENWNSRLTAAVEY